ncbi:hypothetical protein VKT23_011567 [Stygiomarasmius scandens]|uniref:CNNM transmembrane domain-containing protein n=1 Tax=Marasmiellus scandens TaxID=2682957 RepID=A0ABR1J8L0_9AGAR
MTDPRYALVLLLTFLLVTVLSAPIGIISIGAVSTVGRSELIVPEVAAHPAPAYGSPKFLVKISVSMGLVLLGGIFAGLTIALMGLDEMHLRVLAASSDSEQERSDAAKVLNLLDKGRHWVLVVLLLSNVVVNESLPIFLDSAVNWRRFGRCCDLYDNNRNLWVRRLSPIFSIDAEIQIIEYRREVIPQACSVRYGLAIGARCAPLVQLIMWVMAPIAYPIAKLLDFILGVHSLHTYKKTQLKYLLQFHSIGEEPLREEEIRILNGVLELGSKKVKQIMTRIEDVLKLSIDDILDESTMQKMSALQSGYSRIPIHESGNPSAFVGLLLVKKLLQYDHSQNMPVSSFPLSLLPEAHPSINCFQALDYFRTGRAHLLLISDAPGTSEGALGVVTLEDILEEILSKEIIDETDLYEDNISKRIASRRPTDSIMKGIFEVCRHDTLPSSWLSKAASPTPQMTFVGQMRGRSQSTERSLLLCSNSKLDYSTVTR